MTAPLPSYQVRGVRAYIKPKDATTGAFPWSNGWKLEERLIPIRSVMRTGGACEASFRLLRRTRADYGQYQTASEVELGQYIAIVADDVEQPDSDPTADTENVLWWGYVHHMDYTALAFADPNASTTDEVGTVQGQGLGYLLDQAKLTGFRQQSASGASSGEEIKTAPTANLKISGGQVVGNRVQISHNGNEDFSLFTRSPSSLSSASEANFWTRRRLLEHLFEFCRPKGIPKLELAETDNQLENLERDERISWDLTNLSLKGAIDLLIPRSSGLTWSLWPRADKWLVFVDSLASSNTTNLSANPLRDVDTNELPLVAVNLSEDLVYDQVVIQGSPIVFGFTWAIGDSNGEIGWTTTQETRYRAGASTNPDGSSNSGYAAMSDTEKKRANREVRQNLYGDVFTRFLVKADSSGFISHKGTGSGTGSGSDSPAFPTVTFDSAGVPTVSTSTAIEYNETPYLPEARMLRTIPWIEGVPGAGPDTSSDLRSAETKARPRYLSPRVFRYISTDTNKWTDLLAVGDGQPGPQLDIDERAPALRVAYTPPELLAKAHWTGATTPFSVDPDTDSSATDYTKLVFTVAMESDQRLEVKRSRRLDQADPQSGIADPNIRRPLVIRDEDLEFWYMHTGSVVGVKADRSPDRVASGKEVVRNDAKAALAYLDQVAAFALVQRTAGDIVLARPDKRYLWAEVGELLDEIIERAPAPPDQVGKEIARRVLKSTVEEVERTYDPDGQPRLLVRTAIAEIPSRAKSIGAGGGGVSRELSSKPREAILSTQQDVRRVQRDQQKTVVVPPRVTGTAVNNVILRIIDGQTLYNSGGVTYYGVKYVSTAITSVPSAYDPNSVASTAGLFTAIDGIGRCQVYVDGVLQAALALVVHQTGNSSFTYNLTQTNPVIAGPQISIPVSGGDAISAYTLVTP